MASEKNEARNEAENDFLGAVLTMAFPKDRSARVAYDVYKPQKKMYKLPSESERNYISEAFSNIDQKGKAIPFLSALCLKVIATNYKGGKLDKRLDEADLITLGEHMNINLPLIDIIDLENEAYWKRVFLATCKDIDYVFNLLHDPDISWKRVAVEEKFASIIQTTAYEKWFDDFMSNLAMKVGYIIQKLKITHMVPLKEYSIDKNDDLGHFKVRKFNPDDCHHGNLDFLGYLVNLTSLHFEFGAPILGKNYQRRFFSFSQTDIENLAMGFKMMKTLKELRFRRSQFNSDKVRVLVNAIMELPLEIFDMGYCDLDNKCAIGIAGLLMEKKSLTKLELEGNYFSADGISAISYGIKFFVGQLEYLGLARNPVSDAGVEALGGGLFGTTQVKHLNVNGIIITRIGCKTLIEIIKMHSPLQEIDMCSLPFGLEQGNHLIEELAENKNLRRVECRGCKLTEEQATKIALLLARNSYYHQNPLLLRAPFTEEDEKEIVQWTEREKNPALIKMRTDISTVKECKDKRVEKTEFENTLPAFMPSETCIQKSTKDILNYRKFDYFDLAPESEPDDEEEDDDEDQKKSENPNDYGRKALLRHMGMGVNTDYTKDFFRPRVAVVKLSLFDYK